MNRSAPREPDGPKGRGDITIPEQNFIKLLGALALLVCGTLFGVSRLYSDSGHVTPPQGDSLIFYQYARSMAEGHPYRFHKEAAPSTGSTSHLYPMLLALPYLLGAKSDGLATAGFLLNALCYIALVLTVWLAARRMMPSAAPLAALLTALSGQTAITLFGQTDMGLFTALSVGAFCAGLHRRYFLLAALLVLCTLTRPEGALLSAILFGVSFIPTSEGRRGSVGFTFAGFLGLFSAAIIAFFNYRLTGTAGFTSVIGKGLISSQSGSGVVMEGAGVLGAMFKEVFFGLTDGPRKFYLLPVFGGWLGVLGLLSRRWRRDELTRVETWWLIAVLATVLMVSLSGWEGVQFDRYLAWILPVWFIYVAIGLRHAAGMFPWGRAFLFMSAVLLAYQALGLVYFTSVFAQNGASLASSIRFIKSASQQLPAGSRVGVTSLSGMAYFMPEHSVTNVFGVVTPEFANAVSPRVNIEVLKHDPAMRFDAWMLFAPQSSGQWYSAFVGPQLAAEPPVFGAGRALALHRADWSSLERSTLPLTESARQFVYGLGVVDTLNIGSLPDEKRTEYRTFMRVPGARLLPVSETMNLAGRPVTEAGRVVLGSETMRVKAEPGREMRVVLRTGLAAAMPLPSGLQAMEFSSPINLLLQVDGKDAGTTTVNLNPAGEFTEISLRIPGELITKDSIELTVGGDHISYAYWFYQ